MSRKLVDPVQFFDAEGHSMVSREHLLARIKELEAENTRLRAAVTRQQNRLEQLQEAPPTLH